MITLITYLIIWVAETLRRNGRIFLVEAFGKEEVADSVNHLLVVGFYLINIGFISLFLRMAEKPQSAVEAVEFVSFKIGVVLVVVGAMHFFNVFNFAKIRRKGKERQLRDELLANRIGAKLDPV
jgi:membrane-bound ClpP family serine protease